MKPNLYLLAFTVTATVAIAVWVFVFEPKVDARRHPGDQLVDEIEAWLSETRR